MSELLRAAFAALGPAARRHEIELVARALRESGDAEAPAVFGLTGPDPGREAPFDGEACSRVQEIAVAAGAGGFVGLDLYTEMVRPGWSPFPAAVGGTAADGERTIELGTKGLMAARRVVDPSLGRFEHLA